MKKNSNFKVGDKVVYPSHGVGEVCGVKSTNVGGAEHKFYEIKIYESGMKIMVPVAKAEDVGLRPVVGRSAVSKVYKILRDRKVRIGEQTWNRRFRKYSEKIKTGSVYEMAEVLRDLSVRGKEKQLSFGEKKMFDTVKSLLVSEIAVAKSRNVEKVMGELSSIISG
ncbi:MAG: CarD family transcriptional regulator [Candidatus Dadabacteria bacterium]|nr:MAG: CarD family transcriptional regulator [Candidatus Dadabacteria bacterium]